MPLYIMNPRKRRRGKKRRSAAQRRATAKLLAFNRARKRKRRVAGKKAARKRRAASRITSRRRKRRVQPMAKKRARRRGGPRRARRRGRSLRSTPVRGRMYRRNPKFRLPTFQTAIRTLQRGAFDAAGVVGGKAVTRIVANLLPFPKEGIMNIVTQGAAALVAGLAANALFSPDVARMFVAGGLSAPIETLMKGIPVIGPALGDDDLVLGEMGWDVGQYDDVGAYEDVPMLPAGAGGVGEYEDVGAYEYA